MAFIDENEPQHVQPQMFPRRLEGKSVKEMEAYIIELEEEIVKVRAEITKRGGVKSAAESLFK